jgi:hypothetical protein
MGRGSSSGKERLWVAEGVGWKSADPTTHLSQRSPPFVDSWQLMTARTRCVSQTIIEVEAK